MFRGKNRFEVKDQKGATLIEASFILPIFFLFSFGIILICAQLFSVYSTYYACIQSLKSSSTGPIRNGRGQIVKAVEVVLRDSVEKNLKAFSSNAKIVDVIVRNDQGCYYLYNRSPYQGVGCSNEELTLRITPNSWVTIEIPVKPINIKFQSIKIPSITVRSSVKMYDWTIG